MGSRLARLVTTRPRAVLLVALAVGAAATPFVLRMRLDANVTAMVPGHEPTAVAYARYAEKIAAEQSLYVVVECDDPARLTGFADRLAERMRAHGDVAEVRARLSTGSLDLIRRHLVQLLDDDEIDALAPRVTDEALRAQARRLRALRQAPGGAALEPFLIADPLELLPAIGARLQAGLPVDPSSGYFKSADGKALLLLLRLRFGAYDVDRTRALLAALDDDVRALGGAVPPDGALAPAAAPAVGYSGSYAYVLAYRDALHRDVTLSTVISLAAVLFFFALLLGALRAIPLVALPLVYGVWLTGAAAFLLYGRVNAVSLAFGAILFSIGIDLPIQLYNRLREELDARAPMEALERTVARLAGPALLATLGPAAVFFCCALSDYRGLAELGVLAGVGLIINLAAMLTVLPSLLALVPPRFWAPRRRPPTAGRWFAAFGRATARRPRTVLAVVAACAALASPLALKLPFERRLISIEPPGMAVVRVQHEMEARFGERQQIVIALAEERDPERALQRADRFRAEAERLRKAHSISSYESASTLFPSLAEQQRRRARLDRLDPARIARSLRAALDEAGFQTAPFEPFLAQLAGAPPITLAEAGPELSFLLANTVRDEPSGRTVATYLFTTPEKLDAVVAALRSVDATPGAITGQPLLERTLREVVVRDTGRLTAASVGAVVLLLLVYYRRLRPVVAVVVPLSAAWIFFAVVLGACRLPINLFNLLAVPLVVGYGIDDHVFLLHRHAEDPSRGPERALASTGRAIVVTSLSTMAGFAGLAVARFDGLRSLGLTGAIAVALCLLAAMAVLPALLALLFPAQGVDGGQVGGAARGLDAGGDSDGGRKADRDGDDPR